MSCRMLLLIVLLQLGSLPGAIRSQTFDIYSRPRQAERSIDYDVLHYRIQLDLNEVTRSFAGSTRVTLRPLRDGFDTCVLDAETFTVQRVEDDHQQVLRFEQTPGKLVVRLARSYDYHGQLSFTVFYRADDVQVEGEKYGMGKGYALGLSFLPATEKHPELVQTLSFPTGARHWFPCFDYPRDKATSEVIATVRAGWRVISNGRLREVSEDSERGRKTFHWSQEKPHSTYLCVLIAGPYVKLRDSLGALPLGYWVYPKDVDDAPRSFRQTPQIIEFFEREYGYEYPWGNYDQITIPGIGGGAECTNATVLGQSTIHDEKAEKDFPSHWLVAHEAAHQWWGDLVTMRGWSQTWINEGFATYGEYLYAKYSLGPDEGALNLLGKKNSYLAEARNKYMRPIVFDRWEYPNDNFDRHTYQKAAVVLEMLRWVLGEEAFHRSVAYFLRKHAYQPVDTHDLQIAIGEATGQVLDWFFEQWIYKAGHPVFDIQYEWLERAKKLRLTVAQTQPVSERIPVFQMPVVIGITTASGKRSEKIWIREAVDVFELDCLEKPLLVRFDEGNYLLKEWTFPKSDEELLYQLGHDDATGRMWAASELGNRKRTAAITAALSHSAREDEFWAVRRAAIEAMALSRAAEYGPVLRECAADSHSRVRAAALKAMGERRDCADVEFFEDRFRREDSYVAQAEAVRVLGKCGSTESVSLLGEAARMDSPREIVRRAAEWALEELRETKKD